MNYSEKLRDPRWQRKRLGIMQRDNFQCQECGAEDKFLNVHHLSYENGRDPWDYLDDTLVTLCENCHEAKKSVPSFKKSLIEYEKLLIKNIKMLAEELIKTAPYTARYSRILHRLIISRLTLHEMEWVRNNALPRTTK